MSEDPKGTSAPEPPSGAAVTDVVAPTETPTPTPTPEAAAVSSVVEPTIDPPKAVTPPTSEHDHHGPQGRVYTLALAALGVVFGDIGTSPLYTLKECVSGEHHIPVHAENLLGILSLIFWSLTMVVTVKYLTFIMRADNRGEGGILALLALVPDKIARGKGRLGFVTLLVVAGAALLYGDGIITPAISVLSAMEGLEVSTDSLKPIVVPLTCVVLFFLFWVQKRGTETIGRYFGPIMFVWFATIGGLGIIQIIKHPFVLSALSPLHAIRFLGTHQWRAFALLGSVVLAVTGGEALYADMGHFGLKPIRYSWIGLVMPALVLSYFGQGALLIDAVQNNMTIDNPFFAQVPKGGFTLALVLLSTMATVIASQALISGAFSLTHQGVQLGLFPRVTVKHTSSDTEGQIYIPEINWLLAIGCIILVIGFKESSRLAAAYGIAVTGTMGITSIIFYVVARSRWHWPRYKAVPLLILFLSFDLPFFGANLLKFFDGGYVPMMVGAAIFGMMAIWRLGKTILAEHINENIPAIAPFLDEVDRQHINRVPGTAVFMASTADRVPPALLHLVRRVHARPERILLVTVLVEHTPYVPFKERIEHAHMDHGVHRVLVRYGYMQQANIPDIVALVLRELECDVPLNAVTYYLGRETFLATNRGKMRAWSERLFAFFVRNAISATAYFQIPPDQVVEIGTQLDL